MKPKPDRLPEDVFPFREDVFPIRGMLETQVMPFLGGCLRRRYFPFQGDHFGMGRYEGESTQSCEARFSPSSSPFPGTQLLQAVGIREDIGGAMDSTTLAVEG